MRLLTPTLAVLAALSATAQASDLGHRRCLLWEPVEWSIENPTHDGNPFDLVATVTFKHAASGEVRKTEMFYDGARTWKFRFCPARTGKWTLATASGDKDLAGHTAAVTAGPNPDPNATGFLTHKGNRFAVMTTGPDDLRGYLFNVFMNQRLARVGMADLKDPKRLDAYLKEVRDTGFEVAFAHVIHNWFQLGAASYKDHARRDPDIETFRVLDAMIKAARARGMRWHFWAWGDESRKWTPIGIGGINGKADRRLQRYICARLGPLPGWTLGYGFDLHEWVKPEQVNAWAKYMHAHLGWDHLLCARGIRLSGDGDMNSYDGFGRNVTLHTTNCGPRDVAEILRHLDSDKMRPHFYEERHSYQRKGFDLDMDGTRRLLWRQAMAGGLGGFYGFYARSPYPYPNPEQLKAHYRFWHTGRRFLLDMQRAPDLTDGLALKDAPGRRFVFYKENAESIRIDLSNMAGTHSAVAVDARKPYKEVPLGRLEAKEHTWKAPHKSDWAVAVGEFGPGRR